MSSVRHYPLVLNWNSGWLPVGNQLVTSSYSSCRGLSGLVARVCARVFSLPHLDVESKILLFGVLVEGRSRTRTCARAYL